MPIELKAGKSRAMKSLHHFMHEKGLDRAVRLDANPPSDLRIAVRTTHGDPVSYQLLSLPLYMAWALPSLLGASAQAAG